MNLCLSVVDAVGRILTRECVRPRTAKNAICPSSGLPATLNANDQVNPDAAQGVPHQSTELGGSGSTHGSFSAFNPFGEFEGKTIDRTEYFGGGSRFYFTDGTSGFIDIVVPTDKISVKEMIAYQAKGILVLSGGMK